MRFELYKLSIRTRMNKSNYFTDIVILFLTRIGGEHLEYFYWYSILSPQRIKDTIKKNTLCKFPSIQSSLQIICRYIDNIFLFTFLTNHHHRLEKSFHFVFSFSLPFSWWHVVLFFYKKDRVTVRSWKRVPSIENVTSFARRLNEITSQRKLRRHFSARGFIFAAIPSSTRSFLSRTSEFPRRVYPPRTTRIISGARNDLSIRCFRVSSSDNAHGETMLVPLRTNRCRVNRRRYC